MPFEPFVLVMLRSMAAGLGVSYESISRDFSKTNYSSSRLALLEDRENWRTLQQKVIRCFHQRVLRAWLRASVNVGELSLPGYQTEPERFETAVKWVARGWDTTGLLYSLFSTFRNISTCLCQVERPATVPACMCACVRVYA